MADTNTEFTIVTPPGQLPKINSIYDFSSEALGQLKLWFEQNPPVISISQITGYSQVTQMARVTRQSTTFAVANNTNTNVQFDTEVSDTGGIANLSTDNTKLTIQLAGKYIIGAAVDFANNTTGQRAIYISKNASTDFDAAHSANAVGGAASGQIGVITVLDLAKNDYLQAVCFQNSGGSLNLNATKRNCFWLVRVGP